MNSFITCPDCGGLLFAESMHVVRLRDGSQWLMAPLRRHSCDPESAYVMPPTKKPNPPDAA